MTTADFRTLALALPLVAEGSHMGHADFRVGVTARSRGKVFASLPARRQRDESDLGMVVLTPEAQREHVAGHPGVFVPAAGAWGARGCTYVVLAGAGRRVVGRALKLAWENVAPEALVAELVGKKKPGSTPERSRGRRSARGSRG